MGEQWGGPQTSINTGLLEDENNSHVGIEYRGNFVRQVKQLLIDYCQKEKFFSITQDDINNSKITVSDVTKYLKASGDVNIAATQFVKDAIKNAESIQNYVKSLGNSSDLWVALKLLIGANYDVNLVKFQYYNELGKKVHDSKNTVLENLTQQHKAAARKKNFHVINQFKLPLDTLKTNRSGLKGKNPIVKVDPYAEYDLTTSVGPNSYYVYTEQDKNNDPFSMQNSTAGGAPTKKRKSKLRKNKSKSKNKKSRKSRKSKRARKSKK